MDTGLREGGASIARPGCAPRIAGADARASPDGSPPSVMIPPMLVHPNFDPVAIAIGPVKVHWYGLMYLIAFALGWWLGRVRARDAWRGWSRDDVGDVLFWVALGVVVAVDSGTCSSTIWSERSPVRCPCSRSGGAECRSTVD